MYNYSITMLLQVNKDGRTGHYMNKRKKITIYDIAEVTGFSITTVTRALNHKGRINEDTRRLIMETADKLGYQANPAAQGLSRKPIKLGAILYCPVEEYLDDIYRGVAVAAHELQPYNVEFDLRSFPYTNPRECCAKAAELLQEFHTKHYDGVLLTPSAMIADLEILCEPIAKMAEDGIPVVTIVDDMLKSKRLFYVGVDAFTAGKMAAELLSLTSAGRDVAILTHSVQTDIHQRYLDGFAHVAGNDTFRSVRIYSHYDDPEQVRVQTEQMLRDNPELRGVYITSAISPLACRQILASGRSGLNIVTTDLLDETPALLSDPTALATIYQDPYRQGKTAAMLLYDYLLNKKNFDNHLITPIVVLRSNYACYRNWKDTSTP